jgi:ferritin-like metal-binding protein YciE
MALFSMDIDNLQQLFLEQLSDLHDCEQQITKALPKLIDKTNSSELKSALQQHLDVTRQQLTRLDQIFQELGKKPLGETCKGMKGVLSEGEDLVSKGKNSAVVDAGIITSCQRVEHYEIAGYGTVKTYARQLGWSNFAQLLEQTLSEEKEADQKLTQIAETLNVRAREAA